MSFRKLALLGTALSLAGAVHAEKVVFNGAGDFSANRQDTLTDTAQVVDVRTTTGNILLNFANLQAASSTNGSALFANVTTAGTIGVTTGIVNVSGTDVTNGVNIAGTNGDITLTAGTTTANTNANDRAINVTTPMGNITINSTTANGGLRGISTSDGTGAALPNRITTIISGTATANSGNNGGVDAIVGQGATVNITSGTASTTNAAAINGAGIFVQAGAGGSTIKSTTVSIAGLNQSGIEVNSFAGGGSNIDSGTVTVSQGGKALYAKTSGAAGANTIKSGTINLTGSATGIQIDSGTGASSIDSGAISGASASQLGIVVNASTGTTAIKSDNINLTGANSGGITVNGGTAATGNVTIDSNKINVLSQSAIAYSATFNGGTGGGTATVNSTAITGTASGVGAISVSNNAATTITSGSIVQTVATGGVNSLQGAGISVISQASTQTATINSGSIAFTGTGNSFGIQMQAVGGGAGVINSGSITTTGNGGYGVLGYSTSGAITLTSTGDVTTVGTTRYVTGVVSAANARYADGLQGFSQTGAVTVSSAGTVSTGGVNARGIAVEAGRSLTDFGTAPATASTAALSITNTGTVRTTGANAEGILVKGDNGTVTLASNVVTASGAGSVGIRATTDVGAVNVTSTNVSSNDTAIRIVTTSGAIVVNSGTTLATASGSRGVHVQSTSGNQTVTSANATGDQRGIFTAATTGTTTINSTTATATGVNSPNAIVGQGATVTLTSGTASVSNTAAVNGAAIFVQAGIGGATVNAGTTSAAGSGTYGIDARSTGALSITSGTTSAAAGIGILANATGLATVNAASTTAAGNGYAGVSVTGGTGVNLTVGSAFSTGTEAVINTVSQRADAVLATATTGAITANIGSATATGLNADAVRLIANGTGGAVTATITGALASTSGTALFIDPPGAVSVTVAQGASLRGLVGIDTESATGNSIVNLGTVASTGTGPAILAAGITGLDNSGTITAGSGGVAVQLGATNDTVTLRNGSAISGTVVGGGGTDTAILSGTSTTATAAQSIAAFSGFNSLTVASGYWTPGATPSAFTTATIANGATLELANGATGITGLIVPSYTDNGTLVVRQSSASAGSTFGAANVTGSGTVLLTGTGTATLDGVNSVQTTGGIRVDNGSTLVLTGTQAAPVSTTATGTFQIGTGGTTGTFTGALTNEGTFVLNRSDSFTLTGAITGAGTLVKNGAGTVTFGTGYAFTGTTQLNGGGIKLSTPVAATTELDVRGTGTVDLSGLTQTVAELAGNSTAASVNIAGGALTVNQATSTAFAGNLTGAGALTKTGSGTLNLTGVNTFTGPTTVSGGRLAVNGSIVSPATVTSGGTLGGTGTTGNVTIGSGGTFAPGNSVGTINVAGTVNFAAGSTFAVEANNVAADRVVATGAATIAGGTVAVTPDTSLGQFGKVTSYNILTASSVTGTFTSVTSSNAALLPTLSYTATGVNLTLSNAAVSFGTIAVGSNQVQVANAVFARGFGNPLFNAVLVQPTAAAGQAAFDNLSGELNASVPSVLIDEGRRVREAMLDRAGIGGEGAGTWATGLYNHVDADARGPVASLDAERKGVVGGLDYGRDGWRIGAAAGYVDSDIDVGSRASHADVETTLAGVYGGLDYGRLEMTLAATYAWHDIDSRRTVSVAGLAGNQTGTRKSRTMQFAEEVSYKLVDKASVFVAPFGGVAYVRNHSRGFAETGTAAALTVASDTRKLGYAWGGLKVGGSMPMMGETVLRPRMSLSYLHGWGEVTGFQTATFGGTGAAFSIVGARVARNAFNADGGFDVLFGDKVSVGAGGYASADRIWTDYGAKVTLGVKF